jgi:hypothetical protein
MAKLTMPADAAKALTVPELLLCVASGIDFKHAKIADADAPGDVGHGLTAAGSARPRFAPGKFPV